jgi:putative flippase GtrA
MKNKELLFLYIVFAVIVSITNLSSQRLVLSFLTGNVGYFAALFIGTFIGVVLGYFLDKNWIFKDPVMPYGVIGKQFFWYAMTGAIHTPVFWLIESIFWFIWETDGMREVGAVLGLVIAYTLKYFILRRYVFKLDIQNPTS